MRIRPAPPHRRSGVGKPLILDEQALGLRRLVVDVAGLPIVVRVGPRVDGPATILLHGAAGSWSTWTPLIGAAERNGAPLRNLVVPDLPGWGETSSGDRLTEVAELSGVVAGVAEQLGFSSWTLVGHSMGGFVALDLAARRPEATGAAALVSPTGAAVVDAIRRPVRGGLRLPWFAGMLLLMRLAATLGPGAAAVLRLLARSGLLGPLSAPLFSRRRGVHPSVTAALARELRPASFVAAARAAGRYDLRRWGRIAAPVVAVRGARDVFSGDRDAREFARRMPHFTEHRLPDAGHFAAIEQPDALVALLRDVFRQAPGGNGGGSGWPPPADGSSSPARSPRSDQPLAGRPAPIAKATNAASVEEVAEVPEISDVVEESADHQAAEDAAEDLRSGEAGGAGRPGLPLTGGQIGSGEGGRVGGK